VLVEADKTVKDPLAIGGRDAWSVVGHLYDGVGAVREGRDVDVASGVALGIVHEVADHLVESVSVPAHPHRIHPTTHLQADGTAQSRLTASPAADWLPRWVAGDGP